ncbi:BLOC-1-related complex subunit 7 [Sapajus apella]|nr:BLOC-1-related complex subunit 7 [Sapajus apella]
MRPLIFPRGETPPSFPSALLVFWPGRLAIAVRRRSLVAVMATGTPDSQARFGQSVKGLLTEKVTTCGTDVIALTKQVLKGSRSSELLGQAARNMVLQEDAILHSEDSLRKMAIITTHLQYQQEAIQKNVEQSSDLQDQLNHLLK